MKRRAIILYGDPTPSDFEFLRSDPISFPSASSTSTLSATMSDAQSAPPEVDQLFYEITNKCEELVLLSNRQLLPQWNMTDLMQTVMGADSLKIPGYLQDTYYDVILRGGTSWIMEDIINFIDLINYTL